MELLKNTLRYQRQVTRQTAYREESAESIVPDTLPDITRIVDVMGTAYIRDLELQPDEASVRCTVRAIVLYASEDEEKLYKLEIPVSFTHRIELRGAMPGNDILCTCSVASADARALNPRKVSVRVNVAFVPKLFAKAEETFTVGIDDHKECCIKTESVGYRATVAALYKNFTLVEDVDVPDSAGSISAVLQSDIKIKPVDIKLMTNRMVIKAEANVSALCVNGDGEYIRMERGFGFTQMADVPGIEEGQEASVEFGLRSFELDPAMDMSGDSKYLSLSAGVFMNIEVSRSAEMDVVTDIYGTRYECVPGMRDIVFTDDIAGRTYKARAAEHVEAAMDIKRIINWRVQTDDTVEHVPGERTASVAAIASLLCEGGDGGYYNVVRRIPLSFDTADGAPGRVMVSINSFNASVTGSGTANIEIDAEIITAEDKPKRVMMVDTVEWGSEYPPDGYSRMSALVRRVTGDEDLWDIAREYRTTALAIALANKIGSGGKPARGELLLIPMKK